MVSPGGFALWFSGGDMPPDVPSEPADKPEGTLLTQPVLIVEDEAMIAWMMESLLEEMGFATIAIAATGEDAVAQAALVRPGLVISDINLGPDGIDGVEAATAIRKGADLSIVFITGYAGPEARERIARDVPGAYLLSKPVNVEHLRRAIAQAVARYRAN